MNGQCGKNCHNPKIDGQNDGFISAITIRECLQSLSNYDVFIYIYDNNDNKRIKKALILPVLDIYYTHAWETYLPASHKLVITESTLILPKGESDHKAADSSYYITYDVT